MSKLNVQRSTLPIWTELSTQGAYLTLTSQFLDKTHLYLKKHRRPLKGQGFINEAQLVL